MQTYEIEQPTLPLNDVLDHLTNAVQTALAWTPEEEDLPRKLAAVRSLARSFCSCVEQSCESQEGRDLLDEAAALNPSLAKSVAGLKSRRETLRHNIIDIAGQFDGLQELQQADFRQICDQMRSYLSRFAAFSHNETKLIQEAYNQEVGGEG